MKLSELPFELILEIYRCLFDRVDVDQFEVNGHYRRSWSLHVLRTTLVCSSWYAVGMEYIQQRLKRYTSDPLAFMLETMECTSPVPSLHALPMTWPDVFSLSKAYRLDYHQQVRQYIINMTTLFQAWQYSSDPCSPVPVQDTLGRQARLRRSVQTVLSLCPNVDTLHFLYDARFTSRLYPTFDQDWFDELALAVTHAQQARQMEGGRSTSSLGDQQPRGDFLSHVVFTTCDTIQRCPCCAGRGWDHRLVPILHPLRVQVVELDQVLPSRAVLECLAEKPSLHTLILRGDILIQASRLARYGYTMSNPPRIPPKLLASVRTLEIYLDGDHQGLDLLVIFRHIYDLIHPMKQLQQLAIRGPRDDGSDNSDEDDDIIVDLDVWVKLQLLAERHSLHALILEDIPGFQCHRAQAKLQSMFAHPVEIVYH
ncbi:hypothetical protein BC940DRAFT_304501 [Gongronella butleri]|nr:hypothetical protein BC940DRAFT_304501 [Gongronella butleri]